VENHPTKIRINYQTKKEGQENEEKEQRVGFRLSGDPYLPCPSPDWEKLFTPVGFSQKKKQD